MDGYRSLTTEDAAHIATVALRPAFGEAVSLSNIERISGDDRRNLVLRAHMDDGRAVIVKATRWAGLDPASPSAFADWGLVKEWTAREVLRLRAAQDRSPLLAGDAANGLIVFEDFGALPSLVTPLMEGTADEAEAVLTAYALAMAQMHVATHDCLSDHHATLAHNFPNASPPPPLMADWLDQPMPDIAGRVLPDAELDTIRSRLANPGPWLALVHADACPDNVLMDNGQARLIDFEFSGPGHILLDATYWRIGFPSCWCAGTVPGEVADRIEAVYRRELASVLPVVADDTAFGAELAAITVARALFSLCWMLKDAWAADSTWGTSTRRSRLLWYLDAAITACDRNNVFPGIQAVMTNWRSHLGAEWPDSIPLPLYPAFA